jgi:GntR family transcriptional regulator / MocR family aminotransferase
MFPALRLGYMVIPKELMSGFVNVRNASDTFSTSVLYQMAMTDFIREGHFSRHIKRMRTVYMERRRVLAAAIQSQAHDVLELIGEEAGMYVAALLPPGVDDREIVTKAHQMGIRVNTLSECYASPPGRVGLILQYAYVESNPKEIWSTVDTLTEIIRGHAPRHRSVSVA